MNGLELKRFTAASLLVGLVLLLGFTPIGLIPLGFINVTILCIPVVIGTLLMGLKTGLLLGFTFGSVSLINLLGPRASALASALLGASPVLAVLMCYVPRLLLPLAAHLTFRALKARNEKLGYAVAALAGSLTNTVFYLGLMFLFYVLTGLDVQKVALLIGGTGLIAGTSEAVVAALLVPPIVLALKRLHYFA